MAANAVEQARDKTQRKQHNKWNMGKAN